MTYRMFETDKEYQQAAIAYVALTVYEIACHVIADGNIADISEQTLFQLLEISQVKKFDQGTKNAIAMYANLVQDENQHMESMR